MTSEDIRSELEKRPFVPLRLHLVSGAAVEVGDPGAAWLLQNAVLVFHARARPAEEPRYDILSLRNIERLEQLSQ